MKERRGKAVGARRSFSASSRNRFVGVGPGFAFQFSTSMKFDEN